MSYLRQVFQLFQLCCMILSDFMDSGTGRGGWCMEGLLFVLCKKKWLLPQN